MKRPPLQVAMLACLLATATSGEASAADPVAGRQKAEMVCQTCHGMDGQATLPDAPHISGQQETYLVIQLEAYRDGSRQHPQMSIVAQSLSDDDIRNLAAWYSAISVTVELPAE